MGTFITGLILGLALGSALGYYLRHHTRKTPDTAPLPNQFTQHRQQQQLQKRQALEDIINYAQTHSRITNDEVEQLTNVSDATATRYLEELRQQGKLDQKGETGRGVYYTLPK